MKAKAVKWQEEDKDCSSMMRFYKFAKHKKMDYCGVAPLKVDGKLTRVWSTIPKVRYSESPLFRQHQTLSLTQTLTLTVSLTLTFGIVDGVA